MLCWYESIKNMFIFYIEIDDAKNRFIRYIEFFPSQLNETKQKKKLSVKRWVVRGHPQTAYPLLERRNRPHKKHTQNTTLIKHIEGENERRNIATSIHFSVNWIMRVTTRTYSSIFIEHIVVESPVIKLPNVCYHIIWM